MNRTMLPRRLKPPLSLSLYASLLALYPADHRAEYGEHMLQVFGDCHRTARNEAGASGVARLWAMALPDLLSSVLEERRRSGIRLDRPWFERLGGLASIAGGVSWLYVVLTLASRPAGGPGRMYRQTEDLVTEFLLAMALIVFGLAAAHSRQFRTFRWWGLPGILAISSGLAAFVLASTLGIWQLSFVGLALLVLGSLFTGLLMTAGGALPRWASPLLVVGTLVFFGFNTEDARALLALPFGASAIVLGLALLRGERLPPSP